jgi:hypothetical protein
VAGHSWKAGIELIILSAEEHAGANIETGEVVESVTVSGFHAVAVTVVIGAQNKGRAERGFWV